MDLLIHIPFYTAPCADGQLRLAGGNIANEGRVEICVNNEWGTVCDDSWGSTDATVVCRQTEYSSQGQDSYTDCLEYYYFRIYVNTYVPPDAIAFSNAHFGAGAGPIFLNNVGCIGNESKLIDCPNSTFSICSSGHQEDAGVRCQGN